MPTRILILLGILLFSSFCISQPFSDTKPLVKQEEATQFIPTYQPSKDYSIIRDLRHAFDPYSTLSPNFLTFMQDLAQENKKLTYQDYLLTLLPTSNATSFINSFDEGVDLTPNKEIAIVKQHSLQNNTTQDNHTLNTTQKDKPKTLVVNQKQTTIDIAMLAPKCLNKKFNLKKDVDLNAQAILYALAKECNFSIQYYHNRLLKQNPQEVFGNLSVVNIEQKRLDFILKLLLDNIFYEIQPNRLILKDNDMQMFAINYVSSMRMAQSNTDVLFSQEQNQYSSGFYGFSGVQSYQPYFNNALTPIPNQNPSYLERFALRNQLRNQMNYANNQFGKSGTKIYSIDEVNFWADIESQLNILLDLKLGDKFMIDKDAGLISVWTTKPKMQEVSLFLHNLESRMNLQVAIDVEILSLIHFSSNNVGVDWQEIFNILNPKQSGLKINFGGGGTTLTLGSENTDLRNIFNLLKSYGDLRSLSNPKIMALNNQPAIISVGSVLRYSQNLVFQSNNTNNTIQNTSTQYPSVFAGILLDITPSISKDEIILRINPSITKTKDPELENAPQALTSPPNLSTNQLSSIVKLKDGQRVIIGGLLNNVSQNTTQAIPKIGETKGLKRIFGKQNRLQRNEELIIIITPHIIQ